MTVKKITIVIVKHHRSFLGMERKVDANSRIDLEYLFCTVYLPPGNEVKCFMQEKVVYDGVLEVYNTTNLALQKNEEKSYACIDNRKLLHEDKGVLIFTKFSLRLFCCLP